MQVYPLYLVLFIRPFATDSGSATSHQKVNVAGRGGMDGAVEYEYASFYTFIIHSWEVGKDKEGAGLLPSPGFARW